MSKKYTLAVLALILAVSIVASGCTEKSDNPSESSKEPIETFNVVDAPSGSEYPVGEIFDPHVGASLFYTDTIAGIESLDYKGGVTINIREGVLWVSPKTDELRITSIEAYSTKGGTVIEGTTRPITGGRGMTLSSRTGIKEEEIKLLRIGFEPT